MPSPKSLLCVISLSILGCSGGKDGGSSTRQETFVLRSATLATKIPNGFTFCDTAAKGDASCFLEYDGERYVKKEWISYDSIGQLKRVRVYKPEGGLDYTADDLRRDSLLVVTEGWQLGKKALTIRADSVHSPLISRIQHLDRRKKILHAFVSDNGKQQLVMFQYW